MAAMIINKINTLLVAPYNDFSMNNIVMQHYKNTPVFLGHSIVIDIVVGYGWGRVCLKTAGHHRSNNESPESFIFRA